MLQRTSNGGGSTTRPVALTLKGQLAVALIHLEHTLDHLTEAEQADLLAELMPLACVARNRAESRHSTRVGVPLVAGITV
jgi:hypothetical protein